MAKYARVLLVISVGVGVQACRGSTEPTEPPPFAEVTQAGWSFGLCSVRCRGELDLSSPSLSYRMSDFLGDQVLLENQGTLTERGENRLAFLTMAIPGGLSDRYGCPDCVDGGAATLTLSGSDEMIHVTYEYSRPPPELVDLHDFLYSVMDALTTCSEHPNVSPSQECQP